MAPVDLNKAIELNPAYAPSYGEVAFSYHMTKKYDKALDQVNKAIELDSADARFYYTRSLIYTATQKYELAVADLENTIKMTKDDSLATKASNDLQALQAKISAKTPPTN